MTTPSIVSHDICLLLEAMGYGTIGQTIFAEAEPDTPDALVVVRGYASRVPGRTHDLSVYDNSSVQVLVRDASIDLAHSRVWPVYYALEAVKNDIVGSGKYLYARPIQTPFQLGYDENRRPRFAFNVECSRRL